MAHPLRLRIIRACLHAERTNKEIADLLAIDPATCLHHVRLLVESGFLEPVGARPGPRGSTEKPYRSTGKSWTLSYPEDDVADDERLASIDATREELRLAGAERTLTGARLGLKLTPERALELRDRIEALVCEYADAEPDPDGTLHGLYVVLHELA
jgi:predicted ArsR family transcriptional regulator